MPQMPNSKLKLSFEPFSTAKEVDHLFSDVIGPKNIITDRNATYFRKSKKIILLCNIGMQIMINDW